MWLGGGLILLVALGHLLCFGGVNWLRIFAFHMPFFFIVSGLCTSEQSYEMPFARYFIKYVKSLMIPSAIIRVLYILVGMSKVDFSVVVGVREVIRAWADPTVEWFIPVLFLSKILFYWVHKLIIRAGDPKTQNVILFCVVGTAFYLAETWTIKGLHNIPEWLPTRIDCSLVALSFCIIGYLCRKEDLEDIYLKNRRQVLLTGGGFSLLILYLIRFQAYTNVADMRFGNGSMGYYAFACALSFYALVLCRWICESIRENNPAIRMLTLLGRNTLLVYPGHSIVNFLLGKLLYRLTEREYIPMENLSPGAIFLYFMVDLVLMLFACVCNERWRDFKRKHKPIGKTLDLTLCMGLCALLAVRIYLTRI